jgi:hypothetical protein
MKQRIIIFLNTVSFRFEVLTALKIAVLVSCDDMCTRTGGDIISETSVSTYKSTRRLNPEHQQSVFKSNLLYTLYRLMIRLSTPLLRPAYQNPNFPICYAFLDIILFIKNTY